tara:strand:+ start:788 stop:997 length:210 start_codon:yes stop_codon:yes gene_type:complete
MVHLYTEKLMVGQQDDIVMVLADAGIETYDILETSNGLEFILESNDMDLVERIVDDEFPGLYYADVELR